MDSLISCVLILTDKQHAELMEKIEQWSQSIIIDVVGEYAINPEHNQGNSQYYSVQLTILAMQRRYQEGIRFILSQLDYIAARIAKTRGIIVKDKDALEDLWGDAYFFYAGEADFVKDLFTIEERYELIFKSTSKFTPSDFLSLVWEHPRGYGTFNLDLNSTTKELFSTWSEVNISNDATGEVHEIDIVDGFNADIFTIFCLNNL